MIENIVIILGIIFVSLKLEKLLSIPSPLSLIVLSISSSFIFNDFLTFTTTEVFAEEMLIFIVLLVLGDAFILKLKDLKENWKALFFLSVISVILAILGGAFLKEVVLPDYTISMGAAIALFAMVTATDPVSVISVFNQFKVPHKLKILAEGESLFNDAMALTMFSAFGIYLMSGQNLTFEYAITVSTEIFLGSTLIGLIIGFLGLILLKSTKDIMAEFVLIIFIAYLSFFLAEHIHIIGDNHLSGLLAEIVAILTMTTLIDKSYKREKRQAEKEEKLLNSIGSNKSVYGIKRISKITKRLISNITDIKRQNDIASFISVLALLVNGILFVSLGHIIDFDLLFKYKVEILSIFILTTLIRFLLMSIFSIGSFYTGLIKEMNVRWFFVLLFGGIKGGLSIVMLHMLLLAFPTFEHKDLFTAIVSGVIILTTFLYVFGLIIVFSLNKIQFQKEYSKEH